MIRISKAAFAFMGTLLLAACAQTNFPSPQTDTKPTKTTAVITEGNSSSPLTCDGITVYRPLPAFPASNYQEISTNNGKITATHKAWPSTNAEVNKLLPNISSEISVEKLDQSLGIGPFVNAEGAQRRITIDFMKFRSEPVYDNSGNVMLYSRIGAGLRLTLNIATTDVSLGSGSLLAIALSARDGQTKGEISANIIGMNNKDITLSMPFTSDVSEGSILKIIEALAVIKAKLHDTATQLDPQFIAKIDCHKPAVVAN